jgi:hypothetical protein
MNIEKLLQEEISNEFAYLNGMEPGTEKHKTTVEGLTKLIDRSIEMEKIKADSDERTKNQKEDQKDRWIRSGIDIAGILIPSCLTIWGTISTLKYDKEGVIPSTLMGRGFINKLLPRK